MLRYLKTKPLSLLKPPRFFVSDYFGPSKQKLDIPLLDEGAFPNLYSTERRLRELRHDNEIVKNPKKHSILKTQQKKALYGPNYQNYMNSNVREEVKGIRGKTAYIYKNLADPKNPNNYRFNDDVDYYVSNENSKILKKLQSLNYLELKDPINSSEFEFVARNDVDHESLHKPQYPKARNYVAELKPNEIIVQNLPLDSHIYDIIQYFEKCGKIKDIQLFSCVLNLPAFAKITFEENNAVINALQEMHWKLWKNSLISVKTKQDAVYEDSWNRTLCILNISPNMPETKLLEALSEYGHVMHYELPKEVMNPNLPSKEELLEYLHENPEYDINGNKKPISVKIINHILDKGIVETYYFPKNEENEEEEENDISQVLKSKSPDQLKMRFLPREIYHTAEWSSDFLFSEEREKVKLYQSKHQKFFLNKFSSITEENSLSDLPPYLKRFQEEFKTTLSSPEILSPQQKRNIRNSFENKSTVNKGYCFVTYSSTDEAKLVMLRLNRARESFDRDTFLMATLKEDLEPYELDNEFIFKLLKRMKSRYLEFLHEVQKKGENVGKTKQEDILETTKGYVNTILEKKDVRKTMEQLLERELFNDFENSTIGSLKPSENYDRESVGRQNSLEITEKDFQRLKQVIDGALDKGLENFKQKSKSLDSQLTEYTSPLNHEKLVKDLRQLKAEINIQAEKLYSEKFSKTEKKAVSDFVHNQMIKQIYESDNFNFSPTMAKSDFFQLLSVDEEKFKAVVQDEPPKLAGLMREPLDMTLQNVEEKNEKSQFSVLIRETERRERFARFIKYLQKLLLGKFDVKMMQMFDQRGVPLDSNEILIKFSKDVNGNEFLPQSEKERIMEYLSPEDEDEKLKILRYEEEKAKFWDSLTHEQKRNCVDAVSYSLPFNTLFEHEIGIPEKIFKPTLNPGQTVDQLVDQLNKEAELGVEYVSVADSPQGQVIYKCLKPAYRVNLGKMDRLDIGGLKKKAEDNIRKVEGIKSQRVLEKRMSEGMEEVKRGRGVYDDEMLANREVKKAVEELMKMTPFSRAEIEAILKADIRDPEVTHDIAKQLSIEKLKEFKKEIKPEDLIKYDMLGQFSHLKKKDGKYMPSKYKRL